MLFIIFGSLFVFCFVWVWVFLGALLLGCGLGFVLCLGCFLGFVGVWEWVWFALLCMGVCWFGVVVGVGYVEVFGLWIRFMLSVFCFRFSFGLLFQLCNGL